MKRILILILTICTFASFGQTLIDPSKNATTPIINIAISGALTATGTDTYSATFNGSYSYTALTGQAVSVTFTNINTGASTLNFDGLGAKNIYKWSSGSLTAVSAGDLVGTVRLRYDGTQFVMEGGSGSGLTTASNGLTVAGADVKLGGSLTGTTTIAAGTNPLTVTSGVTSGTGTNFSSSTLTTGSILKVENTSTVSDAPFVLNVTSSGANSTSNKTVYGINVQVSNTGTLSDNEALRASASGGTINVGAVIGASGTSTQNTGALIAATGTSQNTALILTTSPGANNTALQISGTSGDMKMGTDPGTAGQVLTSGGPDVHPTWEDPTGGGGSGTVSTGVAGEIAYYPGSGTTVDGTTAIPNGITATTQAAYDNSTKVATTAAVEQLLKNVDVYNVKLYGAAGDGVTDDTAEILAAIAAIPTKGGVLYFPAGNYLVSAQLTLNKNIIIRGSGQAPVNTFTAVSGVTGYPGASNVICNSGTIDLFLVTNTGANAFAIRGFENISIFNNQTTPSAGSGIRVNGAAQNTYFKGVNVTGFYNNINMETGLWSYYEDCRIIDPVNAGIIIDMSTAPDEGGFYLANCFIHASRTTGRNPNYGIHWKGGGAVVITGCNFNSGLNYTLPTIDGTQNFHTQLLMDFSSGATSDIFITNNVFENYRVKAVDINNTSGVTSSHINILGNTLSPIANADVANVRAAINVTNLNQVNISGNTGQNYYASIAYPFISMNTCTNSVIGDNTFQDFNKLYEVISSTNVKLPYYINNGITTSTNVSYPPTTTMSGTSGTSNTGKTVLASDPTNSQNELNLEIGSGGFQSLNTTGFFMQHNLYFDGANGRYRANGKATGYLMYDGSHFFKTVPTGTAGATTTGVDMVVFDAATTANTIYTDADGVGIKNSSPDFALDVTGQAAFSDKIGVGADPVSSARILSYQNDVDGIRGLEVTNDGATGTYKYATFSVFGSSGYGITDFQNSAVLESATDGGFLFSGFAGPIKFATGGSRDRRMTISTAGNVSINALDTDLTAPTTSGTVRMVTTDGTGQLSFQAIPGGGGGITNGAASNELMKSNGTNAVASGLFSTTSGGLTATGTDNQISYSPLTHFLSATKVTTSGSSAMVIQSAPGISGSIDGQDLLLTPGSAFGTGNGNGGDMALQVGLKNGSGVNGSAYVNYSASGSFKIDGLVTPIVESGTSLTLDDDLHRGKIIYFTNSAAITVTVPSGLPLGFNCVIIQDHATGTVSLTTSGTTVKGKTATTGDGDSVSLLYYKSSESYIGF